MFSPVVGHRFKGTIIYLWRRIKASLSLLKPLFSNMGFPPVCCLPCRGSPFIPNLSAVCSLLHRFPCLPTMRFFPTQDYRVVGKKSGKTYHYQRFNCTRSQRVSPQIRKTLSFSKKLENHIGATLVFYPSPQRTLVYLRLSILIQDYPSLYRHELLG